MHTSPITYIRSKYAVIIILLVVLFGATVAIADIISGLSTTSSSTNVTITNLTIAKPSDVAVGDVMIAGVAIHDGNTVAVTAPSGWTQILRTDNDTNISIVSYWKTASASEPANYTWVLSPQTRAEGGITRYSGVDGSNPIDAAAGNFSRSKVATTSPITTTAANEEVVALFALHVGSNNFAGDFFSTPLSMTEKYDSSKTTAGPTMASFDAIQAVAGIAGSKSSIISGNPNQQRDWASQQIALRSVPATILSSGLLSYWKFDESNGDAADSSGNGKTLTNVNTVTYSAAKINNGANMVRPNAQGFTTSNSTHHFDTTAGTVNCWIKLSSNVPAINAYVLAADGTGSGLAGYEFDVIGTPTQNAIRLYFGSGVVSLNGSTALSTGTFYMVTATWNTGGKQLFVNAVSDGTDNTPQTLTNGDTAYTVGQRNNSSEQMDGVMDECGVWNRTLSQSEITALYNSGSGIQHPF
jgi:hypothetical protein